MERSDLTGLWGQAAERKSMPDAFIVTTKSDLQEIIRDAVSEAVEHYERVPELLFDLVWSPVPTPRRGRADIDCRSSY